ncbi:MAG: Rrf2 family transcriptional regulator [Microscillaceae bacterium]|nr:Rrf2 family transcriptional regulator [Microscillaceae bacterium]
MQLSKAFGYGIRALLYIAQHHQEGQNIGLQDLAEQLNAPRHFLGKIMQELSKRGLVHSAKGPGGGFTLKEETLDLPVIKVVEAIDGLESFKKCAMGFEECSEDHPCPLHDTIKAYKNGLLQSLRTHTLRDMRHRLDKDETFLKEI